jgi:hypothetical protein
LKFDGSLDLGQLRHLGVLGIPSGSLGVLVFCLKKKIVRRDALPLRSSEELRMVAELSESKEHGKNAGVAVPKRSRWAGQFSFQVANAPGGSGETYFLRTVPALRNLLNRTRALDLDRRNSS